MKRKYSLFTILTLAVALLVLLCGCSGSYNKILKAFERKGYEEVQEVTDIQKDLLSLLGEDYESLGELHVLRKQSEDGGLIDGIINSFSYVAVLEFKSTDEMEQLVKENESLKEIVDGATEDLQKLSVVSGNCLLVLSVHPEGYEIFKSTK